MYDNSEGQVRSSVTVEGSVIIFESRKKKERKDFVKIYSEGLLWLAKNITHLTTRRVLDVLIANVDYNGAITMSQRDIAEALGIKQQNVSKAITELLDKKIVSKEKSGRGNVYYINPEFAWKNTVVNKRRSKFQLIKGEGGC